MADSLEHVVVVGASLAGINAVQALRRADADLRITIVGDERHLPYDRPPLSKQYLAGTFEREKLRLRAAADPDALGVTWRLGVRATGLDPEARIVRTDDGDLAYDGCVIATGARPRSLPGGDLDGVHVLRTLDDADAILADLDRIGRDPGPIRAIVIGAGFIGAEVAATLREREVEVTLIEAADTPMARVLPAASGHLVADLHRNHGVDVRLGAGATILADPDDPSRTLGVELDDGSRLVADLVVVGIGVIPNTDWLEGSGLAIDDGVVCDATCLAAPGVVVAGDLARWPNPRFGAEPMRIEQWDNAVEQGGYAGRRLLAEAAGEEIEPFAPVPWFWSDQYDRKIQLAGIPSGTTELVHGSIDELRFVEAFHTDGRLVGALAWNRPRHAIQARRLIGDGATIEEAREVLGG